MYSSVSRGEVSTHFRVSQFHWTDFSVSVLPRHGLSLGTQDPTHTCHDRPCPRPSDGWDRTECPMVVDTDVSLSLYGEWYGREK